jgi:peptidoglycan/LPS O-acetylase OafA/YrhL
VAVLAATAWLVHTRVERPARRWLQAPRRESDERAKETATSQPLARLPG